MTKTKLCFYGRKVGRYFSVSYPDSYAQSQTKWWQWLSWTYALFWLGETWGTVFVKWAEVKPSELYSVDLISTILEFCGWIILMGKDLAPTGQIIQYKLVISFWGKSPSFEGTKLYLELEHTVHCRNQLVTTDQTSSPAPASQLKWRSRTRGTKGPKCIFLKLP